MLRLCGAELVEVPAVPYSQPEQLREGLRPARRAAGEDRAERRDLGQPVRQRRQPPGPYRDHRPGNLAADRRQGRRLHLRGRHRRHARRRRHGAEGAQPECRASRSPIRWARRSTATTPPACSRPKAPRSPKASARAASPRNLEDAPIDAAYQIPDDEAVPIVFDLLEHEGLCLGGSTGINVAGAIRLARELGPGPHHRHHPLRLRHALPVEAVQSGLSCAKKTFRSRPGWSGVSTLNVPYEKV